MRRGSETLTNITTHIVLLGKPPVLKALFQPIIERPGTKVRVAVPGVFNTFDDKPGGVTSHVCFIHFGRAREAQDNRTCREVCLVRRDGAWVDDPLYHRPLSKDATTGRPRQRGSLGKWNRPGIKDRTRIARAGFPS